MQSEMLKLESKWKKRPRCVFLFCSLRPIKLDREMTSFLFLFLERIDDIITSCFTFIFFCGSN